MKMQLCVCVCDGCRRAKLFCDRMGSQEKGI